MQARLQMLPGKVLAEARRPQRNLRMIGNCMVIPMTTLQYTPFAISAFLRLCENLFEDPAPTKVRYAG